MVWLVVLKLKGQQSPWCVCVCVCVCVLCTCVCAYTLKGSASPSETDCGAIDPFLFSYLPPPPPHTLKADSGDPKSFQFCIHLLGRP